MQLIQRKKREVQNLKHFVYVKKKTVWFTCLDISDMHGYVNIRHICTYKKVLANVVQFSLPAISPEDQFHAPDIFWQYKPPFVN